MSQMTANCGNTEEAFMGQSYQHECSVPERCLTGQW